MKITEVFKTVLLAMSIALAVCIVFAPTAVAQEEDTEADETEATSEGEVVEIESVVVVGTRAKPRSVLDSAVPIDIVSNEAFENQGGADLPDLLRTLVPSYNVNTQPISDA
ncbi:MAG: TonB-dependent receptor, partial [Candidatus Poribacteria bacterium]|nr:TonB-dependent receptor [Candidatus Poribacteria bacterium]